MYAFKLIYDSCPDFQEAVRTVVPSTPAAACLFAVFPPRLLCLCYTKHRLL